MTNLDECVNIGDTVKIGSGSYTLNKDGNFVSYQGKVFSKDQLQQIAYNDTANPKGLNLNFNY